MSDKAIQRQFVQLMTQAAKASVRANQSDEKAQRTEEDQKKLKRQLEALGGDTGKNTGSSDDVNKEMNEKVSTVTGVLGKFHAVSPNLTKLCSFCPADQGVDLGRVLPSGPNCGRRDRTQDIDRSCLGTRRVY